MQPLSVWIVRVGCIGDQLWLFSMRVLRSFKVQHPRKSESMELLLGKCVVLRLIGHRPKSTNPFDIMEARIQVQRFVFQCLHTLSCFLRHTACALARSRPRFFIWHHVHQPRQTSSVGVPKLYICDVPLSGSTNVKITNVTLSMPCTYDQWVAQRCRSTLDIELNLRFAFLSYRHMLVLTLSWRMRGEDITEEKKVEKFYHVANMSLNPYAPFLREMKYEREDKDEILLRALLCKRVYEHLFSGFDCSTKVSLVELTVTLLVPCVARLCFSDASWTSHQTGKPRRWKSVTSLQRKVHHVRMCLAYEHYRRVLRSGLRGWATLQFSFVHPRKALLPTGYPSNRESRIQSTDTSVKLYWNERDMLYWVPTSFVASLYRIRIE